VDSKTPPLTQQLKQFGSQQIANISVRDLRASTVHLILAIAFFTGAATAMAKASKTPRKTYLRVLRIFLEKNLGINADHAEGMIESNTRLYQRYVLIERVYNAGLLASTGNTQGNELKLLVEKYHDLSMTGLNIEGVKDKPKKPRVVENLADTIKIEPLAPSATTSKRKRSLLLFILMLLSGLYLYVMQADFLMEYWHTTLQPVWLDLVTIVQQTFQQVLQKGNEWRQQIVDNIR
jgi:hypothetical protein